VGYTTDRELEVVFLTLPRRLNIEFDELSIALIIYSVNVKEITLHGFHKPATSNAAPL
jgi:hypothetical protein